MFHFNAEHISHIEEFADPRHNDEYLSRVQEHFDSVYLCSATYESALVSCGGTLSVVEKVVEGKLLSGFALVR